jgi:hypothetical protein
MYKSSQATKFGACYTVHKRVGALVLLVSLLIRHIAYSFSD